MSSRRSRPTTPSSAEGDRAAPSASLGSGGEGGISSTPRTGRRRSPSSSTTLAAARIQHHVRARLRESAPAPRCSNLGDELDATRVHLNHRDVTLICFSRAPIDRLIAYKQRMGWRFPYVSTNGTEFPFDFGLALTPEQAGQISEINEILDNPRVASGLGAAGRSQARGRPAREPQLHRLRARERRRLPHLHGVGTRPVRRAVQLLPARANTEAWARRPAPGARTSTPTDRGSRSA